MAKQTGLYHIRGKVGDYKYYGMKGVDGTIMAKQNEGMSERVKTDAAYDNTRRNNYEFGMATSTAGAITRAFSQKWRYLLVPFATAKIAKEILASAKHSSDSAWGNRHMTDSAVAGVVPSIMQKFVKNDIQDFTPIDISVATVEGVTTVTASAEYFINEKAIAAGCDGVRSILVCSHITPAEGGYSERTITAGACVQETLVTSDDGFGQDLNLSGTLSSLNDNDVLSVILLPYRTVGDEKYIMQEFCSAKFVHVVEP